HYDVHMPFYVGAAAVLVGLAVLSTGHSLLADAERAQAAEAALHTPAENRVERLERDAVAEDVGSAS
ncbi:MFS transporter, partial [Streptomyces sp. MCAF7]